MTSADICSRRRRSVQSAAGGGTTAVVLGAAVAGVSAYGYQVVGSRAVGESAYAVVGILWTLQYLAFSVLLYPLEIWIARTVVTAGNVPSQLFVRAGCYVAAATAAVAAFAVLTDRSLFRDDARLVAVAPATVLAYAVFVTVRGFVTGRGAFHLYGALTAGESGLRLCAAVGVVAIAPSVVPLAWCLPLGALLAAALGVVLLRRSATGARTSLTGPGVIGGGDFLAPVATANVASQALLAGGPLVVPALGGGAADVAVCFVLLTLARAPLVFGYGGLLSRVLPPLTRRAQAGDVVGLLRGAARIVAVSSIVAAMGAAVALAVAEPVIAAVFGQGFRPPAAFGALAVAGALMATGNLLLVQVLVACAAERRLVLPWWSGLLVAVVLVAVLPWAPLLRVGSGLVVGEVTAAVGLLLALRSAAEADALAAAGIEGASPV